MNKLDNRENGKFYTYQCKSNPMCVFSVLSESQ